MKVGTVIENKYEILKLIGKGGMSKVYLAMDQNLKKQWAVKEIEKKEIMLQSALAEANMMKKLDHPNLPRIVDIIDGNDVIYVVMDYIEGRTLDNCLEEWGNLSPEETAADLSPEELAGDNEPEETEETVVLDDEETDEEVVEEDADETPDEE